MVIDVVNTDLEKALDKVPHKRLISKLYSYKINLDIIMWIKSFLFNRRQRVGIIGFLSFWRAELSGKLQSSVLGRV